MEAIGKVFSIVNKAKLGLIEKQQMKALQNHILKLM
jgi:hypothetical protein